MVPSEGQDVVSELDFRGGEWREQLSGTCVRYSHPGLVCLVWCVYKEVWESRGVYQGGERA